jgi:cephalosporin hydroxylase
MRIVIDTDQRSCTVDGRELLLDSPAAFAVVSEVWLQMGLRLGHWTTFSWLGRQLVQLPDDAWRLAEAIWTVRPDVILETGVYEGGSSLLFSTLCRMAGHGRVVSVEIAPRPGVRELLASNAIHLVEGDSASAATAQRVYEQIGPGERVFVFLDSDHSQAHVRSELENYAPLVTPGSYVVVADTILEGEDSPGAAVDGFLAAHPEFARDPPSPLFPGQADFGHLSYFAKGWLRRIDVTCMPRPARRTAQPGHKAHHSQTRQ